MVCLKYLQLLDGFELLEITSQLLNHEVVLNMLVLLMDMNLLISLLLKHCNVALKMVNVNYTFSKELYLKTRCHYKIII